MSNGNTEKICKKCFASKPSTPQYFYKWKHGKDGLADWCKACRSTHDKKVYPKTKERFQKWYAEPKNKALVAESAKRWRLENPEREKELNRWDSKQRYHRKRANGGGGITKQEWQDRLAEFNNHCAYCLQPFDNLEMEHMLPLSRGGTHTIDNIVPACRTCNGTKSNKTLLEILDLPPVYINQEALQSNNHTA